MNKLIRPAWLAITTVVLAFGALPASVSAQGADEAVEEIVTIGTRRQGRTAIDTAVPIDVFSIEDIDSVSSSDLIDVVRTLVPSFNVSRQAISDGATMIRPPTLRGLDADKTLVLVNGKRRHRSALVLLGGFGSHGPDLATIPGISLKSIEVLRDGASALYGSDAVAGVLNFNLRDASEGGEIRIQYGVYDDHAGGTADGGIGSRSTYEGQGGEKDYKVALNFGMPLTDNGFVNVSAELFEAQGTSRAGRYQYGRSAMAEPPSVAALRVDTDVDHDGIASTPTQTRYGPDALTEVYSATGQLLTIRNAIDGIPDDLDERYAKNLCFSEIGYGDCNEMTWGAPNRDGIRVFVNAGIQLSDSSDLYAFFNHNDSNTDGSFYHRRPGIAQFKLSRNQNGEINNPRNMYPGGFTPRFHGNVIDEGLTAGLRGDMDNGLNYDFSTRYGHNTIRYILDNTRNPSMGPESPRTFRPGNLVNDELAFNADFSREFDVGMDNPMNFAFGFEWREEEYIIEQGDTASWTVGPYGAPDPWNFDVTAAEAAAGDTRAMGCYIPNLPFTPGVACDSGDPIHNALPVGSNGFPGYHPTYIGNYARDSVAAYADVEVDVTDQLLFNVAGRYEDFSDFGDNFSWKVASRYTINDMYTIRASVGTGFRAPTPGQISTKNVSTRIDSNGEPVAEGIFPADHPVTSHFGGKLLEAETSQSMTIGISATPSDNLTVTLDLYQISLDDRIVLSSDFAVTDAIKAALLAATPSYDAKDIAQVSFFTNDLTTETQGIDLVATYNMDWAGGNTVLSAAANWNSLEISNRVNRGTSAAPTYFVGAESVHDNEHGAPEYRMNLTARHTMNNEMVVTLRGNMYGPYQNATNNALTTISDFSRVVQWDGDVTWDLSEGYRLTLGINNIFNQMPDFDHNNESCCGRDIRTDSLQDWQGTQYYVRGQISF